MPIFELATLGYGIYKAFQQIGKAVETEDVKRSTSILIRSCKWRLTRQKNLTLAHLKKLGNLKLRIWKTDLTFFVKSFAKIKSVTFEGSCADAASTISSLQKQLSDMHKITSRLKNDNSSGTVSTGIGVAVGAAVMGSVVALPVLAIGGFFLDAHNNLNLANAKKAHSKARVAAAKIENAIVVLKSISVLSAQFVYVLQRLRAILTNLNRQMNNIIQSHGDDYTKYTAQQQLIIQTTFQCAQICKKLLELPLLSPKSGSPRRGIKKELAEGIRFISQYTEKKEA